MSIKNKILKKIASVLKPYLESSNYDLILADGKRIREKKINIGKNFDILNPHLIYIGEHTDFGDNSVIKAIKSYPTFKGDQTFSPLIKIGSNVRITGGLQIHALKEVIIEDEVLFAKNVFISDGHHGKSLDNIPFKDQPIENLSSIIIQKSCWIGQNVVILPGVTIGYGSIIGANSVVTKSIPPKTIAAGCPATIKKNWNTLLGRWESLEKC